MDISMKDVLYWSLGAAVVGGILVRIGRGNSSKGKDGINIGKEKSILPGIIMN